jgi:hypothetical protein
MATGKKQSSSFTLIESAKCSPTKVEDPADAKDSDPKIKDDPKT